MSEITFIGLGAMGTKIASTLMDNDCRLTVWNRSAEKARELIERGALWEKSLEAAIANSPLVMICVDNFQTTHKILSTEPVRKMLSGKTIIQMSTGTPTEAREADHWFSQQGANLLVAMIMVYPTTIGKKDAQLLISGPEGLYTNHKAVFDFLGGDVRYLGPNLGAAPAMSLAILARVLTNLVGLVHGANICHAEGVSLKDFAGMFPDGDRAQTVTRAIESGDYRVDGGASIDIALVSATSLQEHATDIGINHEIPDFTESLFRRVVDAGYGGQDSSALFKVLRAVNNH